MRLSNWQSAPHELAHIVNDGGSARKPLSSRQRVRAIPTRRRPANQRLRPNFDNRARSTSNGVLIADFLR